MPVIDGKDSEDPLVYSSQVTHIFSAATGNWVKFIGIVELQR